MQKLSERDLLDITSRADLQYEDLHYLFYELGMRSSDIERAEASADFSDFRLKAKTVLTQWITIEGRSATRKRVLDALIQCGFVNSTEILAKKWGLDTQGKFQRCSSVSL